MGKALTIVATVAAVAAFAIVTYGAGSAIIAGTSISAGIATAAVAGVTASTLSLVAGGLTLAATLLQSNKAPKPSTTVSSQKQAIPPRVRAFGRSRLHGYFTLFETATDGTSVDMLAFADVPSDGNEIIYLNDDRVTVIAGIVQALPDKKYQNNNVQLSFTLGAVPNSYFPVVAARIPAVTTAFRGDGVCTGYLMKRPEKEKYYIETYPQGDEVDFSRVDRWNYQYDPRDPAQNIADNPKLPSMWSGGVYIGSWKWTENPVLHTLWYLVFDRGYDYSKRILPTIEYWRTAANVCDEAIPLKNGGTEPRYRSCLSYNATAEEKEVVEGLRETYDGWLQERGDGAFIIYAGKIYQPTVSIGPDEIISSSLQNFVETENSIQQVKITYISDMHDYTEVETTPWGQEIAATRVATLAPASPSFSQNRRLAKRIMDRTNAPQRGSITTTLAGRKVRGQRYINLNHTEGDITFFSGIVEITKLTRNFETGGLDFDWIAVDPNIDSWNPETEEGEPAAVGDRVAPEPLMPPIITSGTVNFGSDSGSGATGAFIQLVVEAPDRSDLTWYARTKLTTASVWGERQYPDLDEGPSVSIDTEFVPTDAMVEAQVEYKIGDGRLSGWSASVVVDTSTENVPPAQVSGLTATGGSNTVTTTWQNPTSNNLAYERLYRGTTTMFSAATQVGGNYTAGLGATETVTTTPLAAGTYYTWVRTFNANGVGGAPFGPVSFTVT